MGTEKKITGKRAASRILSSFIVRITLIRVIHWFQVGYFLLIDLITMGPFKYKGFNYFFA